MNSPIQIRFEVLSFSLVALGLIVSWVANIIFGGFKVGRLARRIELLVPREQLPVFLETFHRRLAEIGFEPGGAPGRFVQKGAEFGNLSSFTHAKTPKQLEMAVSEIGSEAKVDLSLRYLDLIVGDTGETAYADAVLAYVASQAETMKFVANRSFLAFSTFVFAIWTWVAMLALKAFRVEPFLTPLIVLSVTTVISGILAVITICMKPGELKGLWLAVAGIIIGALALVVGLAWAAL